jgi:hypothetical protein
MIFQIQQLKMMMPAMKLLHFSCCGTTSEISQVQFAAVLVMVMKEI